MTRLLLLLTTLFGLAAVGLTTTGAAAAAPPGVVIDGWRVGHLPAGLGTSTEFRYEYDDVGFVSRDWESRTAEGWRVDLTVAVLRGAPLTTPGATHDWIVTYQDRPPAEATYHRTTVRGHAAWRGADEVFWFVRPGTAVLLRLETNRWPRAELARIVRSMREVAAPLVS